MRCDACHQEAERLASLGRGERLRRLCPECSIAALHRRGCWQETPRERQAVADNLEPEVSRR